jgi:hypothetical protein
VLQAKPQVVPSHVGVLFAGARQGVQDVVPQVATELFETHAPAQLW